MSMKCLRTSGAPPNATLAISPFPAFWSSYVVDESMMDAKWKNATMSLVIALADMDILYII